ncbi:hypothetical protein M8C21_003544 [Ambrosia artemisiifolia]|uniref:Uncharacterized protein n=1 Tax=Ambrosia artemisiifolia TaxID=4212 RepID=A0AAD5BQ42_AMBAR|nr:hypothetical protein M8C21_003544 [Ambrosia artemisiifolia]
MGGSAISYGHRYPSGRGYWQELIESIVWAHNKLKVAPATQPRALSIVQGRAVGVTHYLLEELREGAIEQLEKARARLRKVEIEADEFRMNGYSEIEREKLNLIDSTYKTLEQLGTMSS